MSDPVAALLKVTGWTNRTSAEGLVQDLAEQGYAIVNEERLARAMHDSDGWPDLRPGHKGEPHLWADCNTEHRGRYVTLAERYLAALREQPMSGWPIHEYDPVPQRRRLRRALLVLGEKLTREMRLYDIVDWLNRRLTR